MTTSEDRINELLECNTRLVNERRAATMLRDEVRAFARLGDQPLPTTPTVPDAMLAALRLALILEETAEVCGAMGYGVEAAQIEQVRGFLLAHPQAKGFDMAAVAKELADLAIVTEGAFSAFGIDSQPVLKAVTASNLSKHPFSKDETGKIQKGPNYQKADIDGVLAEMGWRP